MRHPKIAALATVLIAGCATLPDDVAYLYGNRYHPARLHTYATRVTHIDGQATMFNENPVPVTPGTHVVRLSTLPVPGFRYSEPREMKLVVEPCKRYYLVAERDYPLQNDWRPVVDYVGDSAGRCR